MNNLTFGNDHFSQYETVGGGSGACVGSWNFCRASSDQYCDHGSGGLGGSLSCPFASFFLVGVRGAREHGQAVRGLKGNTFRFRVSFYTRSRRREGPDGGRESRAAGKQILIRKDGSRGVRSRMQA